MKYGFIGCGNMGGAIARALSKATPDIFLSDPSDRTAAFAEELGCSYGDNITAAECCDRLFLAVKPQIMEKALSPIAPVLRERKPLIITIAAGIAISRIQEIIGAPLPIIRIMPNTPVMLGKGMILYCRNELVTDEMLDSFLDDMRYAGILDNIPEHLIDAGSAVSGCGPAYMYMFIEAMADGAVACGIPRDKAITYAAATMAGAAEMVLQTGTHPGALKDAVCSPGGSTIAGVKALEEKGFRGAVMDCVSAAYTRTKELGK